MQLMIFGAGYSGKAIGQLFASSGQTVFGTTRSHDKFQHLEKAGLTPLLFDGDVLTDDLRGALAQTTHLVQSIAPGRSGDPLIPLLAADLATLMPRLEWIGYLSTVGVYGNHDGAWVDEETACRPQSQRSVERVEAERDWASLAKDNGIPLAILRLSGIYGPGRNGFVNLSKGTAKRLIKEGQVFNRIRVEDIAAATRFLMAGNLAGIFNVTDDEPAPPQTVVEEASRLMGLAPPPEQDFESAELSPMARSFYGENKRVSNAKIKSLGFSFCFPDYRQSLAELWANESWNKMP
ncbi:SDR family oxidoreductase [Agrobacterium sp. ES01]|uniref:SDR family oxidoreductase n=1 Tax=Agrobacterium sp. ES01 TaxID=3420714 RepID=UPI003D14EBAA